MNRIYVLEGGQLITPYGSQGLYGYWNWNKDLGEFESTDCHDPVRRWTTW